MRHFEFTTLTPIKTFKNASVSAYVISFVLTDCLGELVWSRELEEYALTQHTSEEVGVNISTCTTIQVSSLYLAFTLICLLNIKIVTLNVSLARSFVFKL